MTSQPLQALRSAEHARLERAEIRRRLKGLPHDEGMVFAARTVAEHNGAGCMTVERLLLAVKGVGPSLMERAHQKIPVDCRSTAPQILQRRV